MLQEIRFFSVSWTVKPMDSSTLKIFLDFLGYHVCTKKSINIQHVTYLFIERITYELMNEI